MEWFLFIHLQSRYNKTQIKMKTLNSNRKFKITHFDREDVKDFEIGIDALVGLKETTFTGTEMQFALQDRMDEVLDMQLWQKLPFKEDRGDDNSWAIIIRIQ